MCGKREKKMKSTEILLIAIMIALTFQSFVLKERHNRIKDKLINIEKVLNKISKENK